MVRYCCLTSWVVISIYYNVPRKIRIEYIGAMYHIMSRGDRGETIFLNDVDRQDFIKTLAEACQKTGWQVHAYCLMTNHYHLVMETPNANLVAGMAWLQSSYTIRFNHRHKLFGHVFSGRYKAQLVEGSGNGYLRTACDYVHLNPVRAGLLQAEDRLLSYPWSSLMWYLATPAHRPGWIRVDRLLGEHGIQQDTAGGRKEFERQMETRRLEQTDAKALKALRRGWCVGDEHFRREMLEKLDGNLGEHHSGELRQEVADARAERIMAEELKRLGWGESELRVRRKSDPAKLAIAARLRRETTLSLKKIAARAHLGTSRSANTRLHDWMKQSNLPDPP
jgi:REP element-mobilizing transposase RayT